MRTKSLWVCIVLFAVLTMCERCCSKITWAQSESHKEPEPIGDALSDPKNPIHVLFEGERLDLWSLRPITKPTIPSVKDIAWVWNPIDSFLLADWEEENAFPAPDVDPRTWLRRTANSLVGLPLSYEQLREFATDPSIERFATEVDRWLASPEYGEHWSRMWLDTVRYSDSNGFDWDEFRPKAWLFRDYVIRAWNQNLPYDQFLMEQLAGDELLAGEPTTEREQQMLIATGYLRLGPYDNAAKLFNEQDRARVEVLSDLTETTASAMLGLTMSCCRCHDHKSDPLSHADHYRFRAFFAACSFADDKPLELAHDQVAIQEQNTKVNAEIDATNVALRDWIHEWVALLHVEPDPTTTEKPKKKDKSTERTRLQATLQEEQKTELAKFEAQIKALKAQIRKPSVGLLMTDSKESIDKIAVLYQGDHRDPREVVEPGFPSVLYPNAPAMEKPISETTTGRRLTLARWIVSRDNPWTARVIVNRIWQMHFGVGIVDTPNDFGWTGSLPANIGLLDYLATELIESSWSIKHIQRLIVTSHAFQQQSLPTGSKLYDTTGREVRSCRAGLKRLKAEELRDAILLVSGQLQHRAGGPPVWPKLSDDILQANPAVLDDNETKTKGWYPSSPTLQTARSIYLIQKRTLRLPWLETFDLPENTVSCPKRDTSIVAPQALALLNGELNVAASQALANKVKATKLTLFSQIEGLFQAVLARRPNAEELSQSQAFLVNRDLAELANVLLNSNEFVFIN
jgi:hypothetical protein